MWQRNFERNEGRNILFSSVGLAVEKSLRIKIQPNISLMEDYFHRKNRPLKSKKIKLKFMYLKVRGETYL